MAWWRLYASDSFAAAWCYMRCLYLNVSSEHTILIVLFGGFLLRLLAIRLHWEMPNFVYYENSMFVEVG
ncbi:hypothetical protein EDF87_105181 [Pseudomonas helmanticensis]|jgi:uncharacterized membrane protein YeiH|uniref:Uncharacterized protein n=2 Tax=Pseudomonas TaxID=286 RepID=A0A4R7VHA9_9PSED|nr:hypothetical protein EDF87_105181 [Pseudomonas helmanticensis]VVP97050.1 hypothetical protein PS941_02224 [Pseudomonas fluorescens]